MAKQIKVIKCPHCGSTQNILIKNEHYRCENCNTEYFLDTDDININVNHQNISHTNQQPPYQDSSKTILWIVLLCIFIAMIFTVSKIFTKKPQNSYTPPPHYSTLATPKQTPNTPSDNISMCDLAIDASNQSITSVRLIYRKYGTSLGQTDERDNYFINFTDLLTGKTLAEKSLNLKKAASFSNTKEWAFRTFDDGLLYAIHNEQTIYQIDIQENTIKDITELLTSKSPDLLSGIATVVFVYNDYGSGFSILTNDGQKVFYYPLINKLYKKEDDYYIARRYFENIPKGIGVDKLQFAFSDLTTGPKSTTEGVPIELIKVKYTDYPNGPKELITRVSWWWGYDQETRQHVSAKTKYRIIYDSDAHRVKDFTVLASGRLFFSPSIFYADQENLFIKTKVNAAPTSGYNLQKIDINNGNVIWSMPDNKLSAQQIYPYGKDQFVVKNSCTQYTIIDATGNTVKTLAISK